MFLPSNRPASLRLGSEAPAVLAGSSVGNPPELPPGWTAYTTDNSDVYYHHSQTGETTWTTPPSAPDEAQLFSCENPLAVLRRQPQKVALDDAAEVKGGHERGQHAPARERPPTELTNSKVSWRRGRRARLLMLMVLVLAACGTVAALVVVATAEPSPEAGDRHPLGEPQPAAADSGDESTPRPTPMMTLMPTPMMTALGGVAVLHEEAHGVTTTAVGRFTLAGQSLSGLPALDAMPLRARAALKTSVRAAAAEAFGVETSDVASIELALCPCERPGENGERAHARRRVAVNRPTPRDSASRPGRGRPTPPPSRRAPTPALPPPSEIRASWNVTASH